MSGASHLVVIGSNPPITSGERTLRRVEVARELLGFQTVEVVNLLPLPTYWTTDLAEVGQTQEGWDQARREIRGPLRGRALCCSRTAWDTRPDPRVITTSRRWLGWTSCWSLQG